MSHDVAVIGLGAMGAAAAWQLAARGLDVVGIDAHAPPHDLGSTHGESRITREGVGEGMAYVPLVRRSHAIWRALEAASGRALFTPCGALVIGARDGFLDRTIAVAEAAGVDHAVLDRDALAARFPMHVGLAAHEIAYHEPGAGFVRPEACVDAALAQAARHGAAIRADTRVEGVREAEGGVVIDTASGPIRAARAVVAAGAGTAALLGAPFDRLLRVTRQTLHWLAIDDEAGFDPARCPVFIRCHEGTSFYGFPHLGGGAIKLATEGTATIDPDAYRPGEEPDDAAAFFARHVEGRLAGVSPRRVRRATCLYTETADAGFLIGPHHAMPRVVVVSACSGHGFKHSAAIGELVAEHVRSDLRLAPFALPMEEVA